MEKPNFKGFMADSAHANWNAVQIVYGSGNPKVPMENRERTCLLHWTTLLNRYTHKHIKPDMQDQHNLLCKQYKDSKTMDEAESRYLAIRAWWLSSGAASEDAIRDLNLWLAFWHFQYRQWGGYMQMVSPSSLAYLVIQSHIRFHNWTLNCNLIFLLFQGLSLEEMADMPSCNLSEIAYNKWLQQFGNRRNNLFAATCDDKI
jgi:hypothetical protein